MSESSSLKAKTESIEQLPEISRFITTHHDNGTAIFSTRFPEKINRSSVPGALFSLAYATDKFPTSLNNDKDLDVYKHYQENGPGLSISTGTVCRIVDIEPNFTCAMHRTVSLDYGVVLEGEVELVLDSGETRVMKRGDVTIQRGTNHAWKNVTRVVSDDGKESAGWARMLYVLLPIVPLDIGGKGELGESVPGMGVRASD